MTEVCEGIIYGAQDMGIAIGREDTYQALLEIVHALEVLYGFKRYVVTGVPMTQFVQVEQLNMKEGN